MSQAETAVKDRRVFLLREWWIVPGGELCVTDAVYGYFDSEQAAKDTFEESDGYVHLGTSEDEACTTLKSYLWASDGEDIHGIEVFELLSVDVLLHDDGPDELNPPFCRHFYMCVGSVSGEQCH